MITGEKNIRRSRTQRAILEASDRFDIPPQDILSSNTSKSVSSARNYAYLRMWSEGMSLPEIGRMMGRHHTTILSGARKAAAQMMEG